MAEERMRILRMLESGQIRAEEAAELLAALEKRTESTQGRWLHVRVTDRTTGREKVHVNVPLGLVDVAIRMGARFAPRTSSVDPQEILEAIRSGVAGKIVEVEDLESGEHVEIFVD
ncbi:MAG: SHOCT-like domain-containing protein [Chloroflexia bacterium]